MLAPNYTTHYGLIALADKIGLMWAALFSDLRVGKWLLAPAAVRATEQIPKFSQT